MYISQKLNSDRLWLFSSIISIIIINLALVWKTTNNLDQLTTDCLFWMTILWLLWQKKADFIFKQDALFNFLGLLLLGIVLTKTIDLFQFESIFLAFFPSIALLALILIFLGCKGLPQCKQELGLAWLLFLPTDSIGNLINTHLKLTIIHAKIATYILYYLGFSASSHGNQVTLYLSDLGMFKAIVGLSCTGTAMIILIFKLALLLISCVRLSYPKKLLIITFSVALGLILGIIRVCILTLLIPNQVQFNYWHGTEGAQIFSTLSMIIFASFCYWILPKKISQTIF